MLSGWLGWLCVVRVEAQAAELRGWWADAFHAGMRNAAEVRQMVADARAGRFNALFVEVRKRGDAYYASRLEPKAGDVARGFDPLAELIQVAHDPTLGARIEVHAWMVTYNIWNNQASPPAQPDHPYRLHPDWLTESFAGQKWDGANYSFDPGHPGVQEHTFRVAMDLVTRYDLDGLHLDYVRYPGRQWGYNPVALERFNRATGGTGRPAVDDALWLQWRRDQVTALVRRIYLSCASFKPHVKISAATITWTPSAKQSSTWLASRAWSDVLQDWRGWMQEGILDLNIPMAYFRQESHAPAWAEWSRFARDHRFQRHVALGVAGYLNTASNTLAQMRSARLATELAPGADGVVCYSYAAPTRDLDRAAFLEALTKRTSQDPSTRPVFAEPAVPPDMPWKADGQLTGLCGYVFDELSGEPLEGALVEVAGDPPRSFVTDANGFYGGLVGDTARADPRAAAPDYAARAGEAGLTRGRVRRLDFRLAPAAPQALSQ